MFRSLLAAGLSIAAAVALFATVMVKPTTLGIDGTAVPKTIQGHCRVAGGPKRPVAWSWVVRDEDVLAPITTTRSSVTPTPLANGVTWVVGTCEDLRLGTTLGSDSSLVTVSSVDEEPGDSVGILASAADSLVETISVQTHIERINGIYGEWTTGAQIKEKLCELGARYTREQMMNKAAADQQVIHQRFAELVTCGKQNGLPNGIRLAGGCWPQGGNYDNASHCISRANAYGDSVIAAFDGWNEVDNKLANWTGPWAQWQATLFSAVNGNATWRDRPVYANSLSHAGDAVTLFNAEGNQASVVDYGNMHAYPSGGMPSNVSDAWIPNWNQLVFPKPLVVTETGYHNCTACPTNGVSELAQAKYMPRLIMEYWNRGVKRTNIYQLIDEGPTPYADREKAWGLVRHDGSEKPSYTALQRLIALLADPGSSFTPGRLDYTLSGKESSTHTALFQKGTGRFYLVMWREVSVWNNSTDQDISNNEDSVTLSLETAATTINVFKPRTSVSPVQVGSGTSMVIGVPDEVIVVEVIQ